MKVTTARLGKEFRCVVTNAAGSTASEAATLDLPGNEPPQQSAPVITVQPENVYSELNRNVTFRIEATGEDLMYQWQMRAPGGEWEDMTLQSAVTAALNMKVTTTRLGKEFRCVVTNAHGSAVSNAATLLSDAL